MSTNQELQKLVEEFEAARSAETAAIKMIDSLQGQDLELLVKVTQNMLQAHGKSMEVYFKLLKYKMNPERRGE